MAEEIQRLITNTIVNALIGVTWQVIKIENFNNWSGVTFHLTYPVEELTTGQKYDTVKFTIIVEQENERD